MLPVSPIYALSPNDGSRRQMGDQGGINTVRLIRVDAADGYDYQRELDLYQSAR